MSFPLLKLGWYAASDAIGIAMSAVRLVPHISEIIAWHKSRRQMRKEVEIEKIKHPARFGIKPVNN